MGSSALCDLSNLLRKLDKPFISRLSDSMMTAIIIRFSIFSLQPVGRVNRITPMEIASLIIVHLALTLSSLAAMERSGIAVHVQRFVRPIFVMRSR